MLKRRTALDKMTPSSLDRVGLAITACVHINFNSHAPQAVKTCLAGVAVIDEIVSCHAITGPIDFRLEVVAPSLEDYFVRCAGPVPAIRRGLGA
ncbi:Lrp/AsnC ligand binding domain-containing protein [Rhodoferax sp.]|uniref:Lrp/AsnC ligand binding domain-containing protein n=1 Tax=Rhodoferax sp. TaxID=50421 RepID=UPI00342E6E50